MKKIFLLLFAAMISLMALAHPSDTFKVWKTITIGNFNGSTEKLASTLIKKKHLQDRFAIFIIKESPILKKPVSVDLVRVKLSDLGFNTDSGATYTEICARAHTMGLRLCPAEVGPELRLQYDYEYPTESLFIMMEPIIQRVQINNKPDAFGDSYYFFLLGHFPDNRPGSIMLGSNLVTAKWKGDDYWYIFTKPR